MALDREAIQKIRDSIFLPDLIGAYLRLKKQGQRFIGLCPFHPEKTPSFHVMPTFYRCFGCGESGDVFSFLKHQEGLSFREALLRLKPKTKSPLSFLDAIQDVKRGDIRQTGADQKNIDTADNLSKQGFNQNPREFGSTARMTNQSALRDRRAQLNEDFLNRNFSLAKQEMSSEKNTMLWCQEQKKFSSSSFKASCDQEKALSEACAWFQNQLQSPDGETARAFLTQRKIDLGLQETFCLGWAPAYTGDFIHDMFSKGHTLKTLQDIGLIRVSDVGRPYAFFQRRLLFPIFSGNQVVGFGGRKLSELDFGPKYLNSSETPWFSKGRLLYGWNQAKSLQSSGSLKWHHWILVEGYTDVLHMQRMGLMAVAPMGTALTAEQLNRLWREDVQPVICFDGDQAGRRATEKALQMVLSHLRPGYTVRIALLPSQEDPGSLIEAGRGQEVLDKIQNAYSLFDFLWLSALNKEVRTDNAPWTPDQIGSVRASCMEAIHDIPDPSIRESYRVFCEKKWHAWVKELFPSPKKAKQEIASLNGTVSWNLLRDLMLQWHEEGAPLPLMTYLEQASASEALLNLNQKKPWIHYERCQETLSLEVRRSQWLLIFTNYQKQVYRRKPSSLSQNSFKRDRSESSAKPS